MIYIAAVAESPSLLGRLLGAGAPGRFPGRGRRAMALGLAAVVAALGVLLALQYRWLADLERASTIARRASLEKYLDVAGKEVAYHYQSAAERALNLAPSAFTPEYFHKAPYLLAKASQEVEGIARLFVVSYHPAYLLRSPSEKARAWQDLKLAARDL